MEQLRSKGEMVEIAQTWKRQGLTSAFVPTMGALHEGHLSLIRLAKETANMVVVSLFVNPLQFGPNEDFERYPRNINDDLVLLAKEGVDVVFTPKRQELYPPRFQTTVSNDDLALGLCGFSRPEHFAGVCTVVLKLFNIVRPDAAVFGKKDYQQLKIVEQMVKDLDLPVKIIGAPIVRDKGGLALSSRNQYLSLKDRSIAQSISKFLFSIKRWYKNKRYTIADVKMMFEKTFAGFSQVEIEYLAFKNNRTLEDVSLLDGETVILCALKVSHVRLIDNIELGCKV